MRGWIVPLIIIGASFLPADAGATGLSGQISSECYIIDENDSIHVRPFERLRADLLAWKGVEKQSLTFHTYLRWTGDWSSDKLTDPQTFVYDAYIKLAGVPRGMTFRAGRQFAYNGIGSALVDGLRVQFQRNRRIQIDLFGGSTVAGDDPETIQSPGDFAVIGGRLSGQPYHRLRLGLNWFLRRADGFTAAHRAGVDAETDINRFHLYGRFIYNVAGLRVGGLLLRGSYARPKWYLSGEFDWREPSVSANSIFSLIDFRRYRELRFEAQRTVWRRLAVVGQLHAGLFENDDSWRAGIGVRTDNVSVVWRHKEGYGGENDGLYGFANVRLARQRDCFATANAGRYHVQEEQTDKNDAYSGSLGLLWRSGQGWSARAEGQYLRNAVMKKDLRLLIRVSKDFSVGETIGIGML
ncbi:MAG: hypothetical protein GYA46_10020 [candidate division Zixibacteria bacterium]|nr:hypothetical protein [candidate division Zixibacteria bacterium]